MDLLVLPLPFLDLNTIQRQLFLERWQLLQIPQQPKHPSEEIRGMLRQEMIPMKKHSSLLTSRHNWLELFIMKKERRLVILLGEGQPFPAPLRLPLNRLLELKTCCQRKKELLRVGEGEEVSLT